MMVVNWAMYGYLFLLNGIKGGVSVVSRKIPKKVVGNPTLHAHNSA